MTNALKVEVPPIHSDAGLLANLRSWEDQTGSPEVIILPREPGDDSGPRCITNYPSGYIAALRRCADRLEVNTARDTTPLAGGHEGLERWVTDASKMRSLPSGTIVESLQDGWPVTARKPVDGAFPFSKPGFWELVGSELGTCAEDLVPARILYTPTGIVNR